MLWVLLTFIAPFMLSNLHFWDKAKQAVWWYLIYPVFPYLQKILLSLHIIHHRGRQPWRIGYLAPGRSLKKFFTFLETQEFRDHFIAWHDDGQILSVRRRDGFKYQYHLRIFHDREIRGHYEESPEDSPIEHFSEKVFEPRTEEFRRWLGNWVVHQAAPGTEPGKTKFHSEPATSRDVPE